ncbi:hypothetical protein ACNKHL_06260 [Shigella flexneri]
MPRYSDELPSVPGEGYVPCSRAVFLTGVMSYLFAPLWFYVPSPSTALQVVHALTEPNTSCNHGSCSRCGRSGV